MNKVAIIIVSLILAMVVGLGGCITMKFPGAEEPAPPTEAPLTPPTVEQQTYTLSISIIPSGAGSVFPSSGQYVSSLQVTLTATPASGYTFEYWDGDTSGSSPATTITMDSDKTVIAHFSVVDIAPLPVPEPEPEPEPEPKEEEEEWLYDSIVYKITGTADRVNVTLFNDEGGIEQYSNVSIPHEYEYDRFDTWYASILAQNQGESGSVIVTIYLNGKEVKRSKSTGAYVIAEASLSLY